MKPLIGICASIVVVLSIGLTSCERSSPVSPRQQPVYTELRWVGTDVIYGDAAGKHDLSVIFFMAEWCGWCKRLKNETLSDSTVIQILGESFSIAWINPDADSSVVCGDSSVTCKQFTSDVFGVGGYPTLAFCDRQGKLIGLAPGFRAPAAMIELLEKVRDGEY